MCLGALVLLGVLPLAAFALVAADFFVVLFFSVMTTKVLWIYIFFTLKIAFFMLGSSDIQGA